jgi:hypothetical protein
MNEPVGSLQLQARLPSSTTNQSASAMGITFTKTFQNPENLSIKGGMGKSLIGLGSEGPVKANQKVSIQDSSSKMNGTTA